MNNEIYKRYEYLISEITKHDKLYEENQPEIGDGEYDDLYFELLTIEKDYPGDIRADSPSQKVNTTLVDSLEKKAHDTPMLSQNKIKTIGEVDKFIKEDISGDVLFEEKLDGLTIVLEYDNGNLECATTRGNGYIGEIVTHNLKTFKNVPKKISFKKKLVLRAEALVLIKEFEKINLEGANYSNCRNLASGTVRQLDSSICSERNMIAKIFDIVMVDGISFKKDTEAMEWVKSIGFDIVNYKLFSREELKDNLISEIESFISDYEFCKRTKLEYLIDGLVIKSNDYEERESLGYTSKWPKWATAFKFKAQEATSTLRNVIWQVGKTGQITPVAIFDKINIDVDIERATLNNVGIVKLLDLKIGDSITVIRSNDVIPKITNVIKSKRTGSEKEIEIPAVCPVCGAKAEFNGENLYCTGTDCQAQIEKSLINFASRNAMNIVSLGKETISTFYENGFLTKIEDIYLLENYKDEICKLDGFGEKKLKNIIAGVEKTKDKNLINLLIALSIRLIADTTAKNVAKYFKNVDDIIELAKNKDKFYEECSKIEDFGTEKTSSLYSYFTSKSNIELIEFLKKKGICTSIVVEETLKNEFISNKTFVITGDVSIWKNRNDLKNFIEKNGGKCSGSVSSKTSYLINNDSMSSSDKNTTAKKLGVPIISEDEFKKLSES